jgi:hypothetical protein
MLDVLNDDERLRQLEGSCASTKAQDARVFIEADGRVAPFRRHEEARPMNRRAPRQTARGGTRRRDEAESEVLDELQPDRATYDEFGHTEAEDTEPQAPGPREQPAVAADPLEGE